MNLPAMLLPTYTHMLRALSQWLTKAAAEQPDGEADALLSAKLAPDMFPLSTQIRFACRQAHEGVSRLRQEPFGAALQTLVDEGRNADANPGTLADAQARIAEALAVVEAAAAADLAIDPAVPVAHDLPNGMTLDLTAGTYARDWALPQFYFHIMTAYAILRAQGIALGKADYAAHMMPYLRPSAAA